MVGETDRKDKNQARTIAIVLVVLLLVLGAAIMLLLPTMSQIATTYLSPGVGMKDAAVISFFVTVVIMIVFALVAGDGLLGEIQFMLGAFFSFFVIVWLLVAWIF
jgi:hypothetical protein